LRAAMVSVGTAAYMCGQPFAESALQTVKEIEELDKTRDSKFKELAEFLGEEKAQPEELFGLLRDFASSYEVRTVPWNVLWPS
jgi:hypothetical protein